MAMELVRMRIIDIIAVKVVFLDVSFSSVEIPDC
jgi:hypothetical protein